MRLAIPSAPRSARFAQVPGAVTRLGVLLVSVLLLALALSALGRLGARRWSREWAFLADSEVVRGTVASVALPPLSKRESAPARAKVLYTYGQLARTAYVELDGVQAERLAERSELLLRVVPDDPEHPREARAVESAAGWVWATPIATGVGVLVAVVLLAWQIRRTVRRELEPLRRGMLVWLTPDGPLQDTRRETTFPAHYYRDDVRHDVRARARPGRAPVRNGEKLLAALVPTEPSWCRVIDEDLARELGWFAP